MKRVIPLLLSLLATVCSYAYDAKVGSVYYNLNQDAKTAQVTYAAGGYSNANYYKGSINIPQSITYSGVTYRVTEIGASAFIDCSSLTSISIPNSVTSIGQSAFKNCSGLTSVSIPNSVTSIGNDVFYGCSALKTATLSNSITEIPYQAFFKCTALTTPTIGNSVTKIGVSAFFGCSSMTTLELPSSIETIGASAFSCTGVTSLAIPDGVTTIGSEAFSLCKSLKTAQIPNSVTSIGEYAFLYCDALTSIELGNGISEIAESTFIYCSSLMTITIPEGVTVIGERAFSDCSGLKSVNLPNSLKTIGLDAFADCSLIESLTIPDFVTEISSCAFKNCTSLATVSVPSSMQNIGYDAFAGCTSLTKAEFASLKSLCGISYSSENSNPLYLAHHLFVNEEEIKELTIPEEINSISRYAFAGCSGLTSLVIPKHVTSVGDYAFQNCAGLKSITLGGGFNTVEKHITSATMNGTLFSGCTNVEELIFAEGCTETIYTGLSSIKKVTIPGSVTKIDDYSFYGCSNLTSVTLPESVCNIESSAFSGCTSLLSIRIPRNVTSVDKSAFSGCTSLTSISVDAANKVYDSRNNCNAIIETATNTLYLGCKGSSVPSTVTSIGSGAFEYCEGLTSIYLPYGLINIESYAFRGCTNLTSISIPNSVKYVGVTAFFGCRSLASVSIGSGVPFIEGNAFTNCSSLPVENGIRYAGTFLVAAVDKTLTSYTIKSGTRFIGHSAFAYCNKMSSIKIPESVTYIGSGAFGSCTSLPVEDGIRYADTYLVQAVDRTLETYNIKVGTRFIGNGAFIYCNNLSSIIIPPSVISIDYNAFSGCRELASISIPAKVQRIGYGLFSSCEKLMSISVDATNNVYNSSNSCNAIIETATNTLVAGCNGTVIPDDITNIGQEAFNSCKGLTSVNLPSVVSIGMDAFKYCSNLTSVTLGKNIQDIGDRAFYYCSNLEEFNCLSKKVPNLDLKRDVFSGTKAYTGTLYVPESSLVDYAKAYQWNSWGNIVGLQPIPVSIVDGEEIKIAENTEMDALTYTRTFANTEWQALYVPFAMNYDDWAAEFEVARISGMHMYDYDEDGEVDETALEILRVKKGSIEPNTPYLIRAKETGEKTITVNNTTLYATEETSDNVSTWDYTFTFTGTYNIVPGSTMYTNGYYALGAGTLHQALDPSNDLKPFRWYMDVENRRASKPLINKVKVHLVGEEDMNTGIVTPIRESGDTMWYDLGGRRVENPTKGLYIQNGKKVMMR